MKLLVLLILIVIGKIYGQGRRCGIYTRQLWANDVAIKTEADVIHWLTVIRAYWRKRKIKFISKITS
jgi:hypothetical protein